MWKIGQLSDLLERGSSSLTLKKVKASVGEFPVFGAKGLVGAMDQYQEQDTFLTVIKDGAGIGRVAINPPKSSVLGTLQILRPKAGYDPQFLRYYLESIGLAEKYKTGSTIPHIYYKDYKTEPAPLMPLKQQKKIVAVLDNAFAQLNIARDNIDKNLDDANKLFESYLSEVFQKDGDKKIEVSVGDLIVLQRGKDITKKEQRPGVVPVVSSGGVKSYHDTVWVKGPGVVVGRKGSIGSVHYIEKDYWPHDTTLWVKDFKGHSPSLISFLLRSLPLKELDTGTANPSLNRNLVHLEKTYWPLENTAERTLLEILQLENNTNALKRHYETQLVCFDKLRRSLLERAFSGELTMASSKLAVNDNDKFERLSTATLVLTYEKHSLEERQKTFGHVKAQKTLHLTESISGLDLGRQPKVRQAGPHDQDHFNRVEAWAEQKEIFSFVQRRTGKRGYDFIRGKNYAAFLTEAKTLLADYQAGLSRFLPLITRMNSEEAEVLTTVHAAWNNLLADGKTPSDEDIVWAAREGWHESKMDIARQKFFDAIRDIRRHDLEPDGSAKYVHGAQESLL